MKIKRKEWLSLLKRVDELENPKWLVIARRPYGHPQSVTASWPLGANAPEEAKEAAEKALGPEVVVLDYFRV